jgi:hypothetical protein
MRNRLFVPFFATLSLILTANLASADQFGTADEARAMLDRAVSALKSDVLGQERRGSSIQRPLFNRKRTLPSAVGGSPLLPRDRVRPPLSA